MHCCPYKQLAVCLFKYSINFVESNISYHRVTVWLRLEGTSRGLLLQPLLKQGYLELGASDRFRCFATFRCSYTLTRFRCVCFSEQLPVGMMILLLFCISQQDSYNIDSTDMG